MINVLIAAQLTISGAFDRFTTREDGQDMIEYALLAALISVVAIAAITLVGPHVSDLFNTVSSALNGA